MGLRSLSLIRCDVPILCLFAIAAKYDRLAILLLPTERMIPTTIDKSTVEKKETVRTGYVRLGDNSVYPRTLLRSTVANIEIVLFQELLGDHLLTSPIANLGDFTSEPVLPSPNQLRYKIIIKNKKLRRPAIPVAAHSQQVAAAATSLAQACSSSAPRLNRAATMAEGGSGSGGGGGGGGASREGGGDEEDESDDGEDDEEDMPGTAFKTHSHNDIR